MSDRLVIRIGIAVLLPAIASAQSNILDASFGVKQIVKGCAFTEGPIVDHLGNLFFSDGPNDRVMQLTADGKLSTYLQPCGAANGLLFDLSGKLLMCQSSREGGGRALATIERKDSALRSVVLTDAYEQKPYIAPNDLCIDGDGSVFFTDPYYAGEKSQPTSGVYRYDANGTTALLLTNLLKPNGIIISADDRWVYISDRGTQQLHRYRVTDDKQLVDDTVIYDFSPDRGIDGMWLDAEGNIYGAAGEGKTTGLFVISPAGKLLLHQPLPEFATNVTFGGDDMKDIYVTATTSVYHLRSIHPGLKQRYMRTPQFEIQRVIHTQQEAWNSGDLGAFLEYYWKSPMLTFSSGGSTRRGWEATRRRYQTRYPTKAEMGNVVFSNLEVFMLANDAAYVLGRWQLRRDRDPLEGNFTLVFRHIDDRWLIVHDHTSLLEGE